jgi:ATP-binding cassette subfamily B protein
VKNIFKIVKISKPLYKIFALLSLLILVTAIIQQAAPIMVKFIVDEIEGQLISKTGDLQKLYLLISLAFGLTVLSITLDSINQRIGDFARARLGKFLTEEFYRKIFTLPQKYFDSEVSGKIVNQLTRGILSITDFMNAASNFILPAFLQSLFTIIVLAYFSPPIAFLAAIVFPIYIAISSYSTKRWGKEEVKKNKIEDILMLRMGE